MAGGKRGPWQHVDSTVIRTMKWQREGCTLTDHLANIQIFCSQYFPQCRVNMWSQSQGEPKTSGVWGDLNKRDSWWLPEIARENGYHLICYFIFVQKFHRTTQLSHIDRRETCLLRIPLTKPIVNHDDKGNKVMSISGLNEGSQHIHKLPIKPPDETNLESWVISPAIRCQSPKIHRIVSHGMVAMLETKKSYKHYRCGLVKIRLKLVSKSQVDRVLRLTLKISLTRRSQLLPTSMSSPST